MSIDRLCHPELALSGLGGSLSGNSRLSSPMPTRPTSKPSLPSIPHSFWNSQTIVPPLPPIPETKPQRPCLDPDMEWQPCKRSTATAARLPMPPIALRTNRRDRCNAFPGMNGSRNGNGNAVDYTDLSDTIAQIRAMAQGPARNAIRECEEKAAREVSAMHEMNFSRKRKLDDMELHGEQMGEKIERAKKRRRLLKNRESAQRSRDKKARYIKCLEHKILEEIEEKIILQKRNQMLLHQCMKLREAYQQQTKESVQIIAQLRLQLAEAAKSRHATSIADRITCSLGNVMMQRLKQEAKAATESRPISVKNPSSAAKSCRHNDLANLSPLSIANHSGTLAREALAELIRQRELLQVGAQACYGPCAGSSVTAVKTEPTHLVGLPQLPVSPTRLTMEKSDSLGVPPLSTTPTDEHQISLLSKLPSTNTWDSPKVAPKPVHGVEFLPLSHGVELTDGFSLSTL